LQTHNLHETVKQNSTAEDKGHVALATEAVSIAASSPPQAAGCSSYAKISFWNFPLSALRILLRCCENDTFCRSGVVFVCKRLFNNIATG